MKLKVKVVGAPRVEVHRNNKAVSVHDDPQLIEEVEQSYDLLEFVGNIKFPTDQLQSLIEDKLWIQDDRLEIVDVTYSVKGDSNEFLLYGEIEFNVPNVRLGAHTFDVSEELYNIFDDVFNIPDGFYDKSKMEQKFKAKYDNLTFYVFWDDDVVQCFGAILDFGGVGHEV